jgi:hypothetical protein
MPKTIRDAVEVILELPSPVSKNLSLDTVLKVENKLQ